jgi:hypothetical protein
VSFPPPPDRIGPAGQFGLFDAGQFVGAATGQRGVGEREVDVSPFDLPVGAPAAEERSGGTGVVICPWSFALGHWSFVIRK